MKNILPRSVEAMSSLLSTLPSIGPKTANRLTFFLLGRQEGELDEFGQAFINLKKNLVTCSRCFLIAETDPCIICQDKQRVQDKLVVVEEPLDVLALEKAHFDGLYHVIGGQISPINNVSPDDLKIKELLLRLETGQFKEVILAMDTVLEGEATALYIDDQISRGQKENKFKGVRVTRIARGLPVGGDLEYADELTLARALEGRHSYLSKN
ncbi:MAG: recombination mediator RecR [Patescibacteria group bacterium]